MAPPLNELEQQEQQLRTEELALEAELASARAKMEVLASRVNAVKQLAGSASPPLEWAPPELPRVSEGEAALERSRKARLLAIEARRTAAADLKQLIVGSKKTFEVLLESVARDEATVKKQLEQRRAQATAEAEAAAAAKTQLSLKAVQVEEPPSQRAAPTPPKTVKNRPTKDEEGAARRTAKRVQLETVLSFSSESNVFMGFSTNVSEGGVFVATHELLPVGTEVDVQFTLPSGASVSAKGKVRWLREGDERHPELMPGIGVQFGSLADDASAALHSFIEERDPMFYAE